MLAYCSKYRLAFQINDISSFYVGEADKPGFFSANKAYYLCVLFKNGVRRDFKMSREDAREWFDFLADCFDDCPIGSLDDKDESNDD